MLRCSTCQSEEIQAQRLRELTERGFSLERAREALAAVGDGSIEEAQFDNAVRHLFGTEKIYMSISLSVYHSISLSTSMYIYIYNTYIYTSTLTH